MEETNQKYPESNPGRTDEIPEAQRGSRKRMRKPVLSEMFQEHGKVPPQAVDLEEAVLGAMMLEKDKLAEVIELLRPEVFYKTEHQLIFGAIQRLFAQVQPVDILTVHKELQQSGELAMIHEGAYYLTMLTNRVASSANIVFHTRILIQKYIQRELIRISSEVIKDAYEDTTDVFDLLDKAESNLFSVSETSLRKNVRDMTSLMKEAINEIKAGIDRGGHLLGVGSGFTEIDRVTSGWQKSDLIILASRPGMGKTAFALTMARNIAVNFKKPVAFFSLEMSAIQLVTRLISSETEIPSDKLKRGNLEPFEVEQLYFRTSALTESALYIDDTPALTIFELRAKARRLKQQHKIEILFIDYLQLMQGAAEHKGNREQEISSISRALKSLAKELEIPIIALSQLSREVEKRIVKKPILSDLRESGSIEQDADMVLFIYRPEYYKVEDEAYGSPTEGIAEISIAKNRNGATKDVKTKFISRFAKFADLEVDYSMLNTNPSAPPFDSPKKTRTVMSKMDEDEKGEPSF
ncbi:MAG TPA: replicative DNA helicase [Bacteroidales bacterium]|nr:replicative DNA helicase [Bacteroidales bacterium]